MCARVRSCLHACVYVWCVARIEPSFLTAVNDRKKKEKSGKDGRRPISNDTQPGKKEGDCGQDDLIKDLSRSEAEMLLLQR